MIDVLEFKSVEQAIDWYEWDKQDFLEKMHNQVMKLFECTPETLLDEMAYLKLLIDIERECENGLPTFS